MALHSNSWLRFSRPKASQRSQPPHSRIYQALRRSPFIREARAHNDSNIADGEDDLLANLNRDLSALANLYPDIRFDVLRELLVNWDGDSRLYVCVEYLIKNRADLAKGGLQNPPRGADEPIPLEESFRSTSYKAATRRHLSQEFPYLSPSTIEGVLAENNFFYSRARPTLARLSDRTWRAVLRNLNVFSQKKTSLDIPTVCTAERNEGMVDSEYGSEELNLEIRRFFLEPRSKVQEQAQQDQDRILAVKLNETEARQASALYECECCFADTTFERIASCSTNGHLICSDCIRHTLTEAIYGQGWAKVVCHDRGGFKCLAPFPQGVCHGYVSHTAIKQSISCDRAGTELWAKFEARLADDALLKSSISLVRCPFCSYAEADPSQSQNGTVISSWQIKKTHPTIRLALLALFFNLLPLATLLATIAIIIAFRHPFRSFQTSLRNVSIRQRSTRFRCRNLSCQKHSCMKCLKAWHDPHTCHEPLLLSLRTTVEAARTAAIKRTCPRCGLSFVKSTGCNKLTCVCGYAMCYLCRSQIATSSSPYAEAGGRRDGEDDMEGYRHFCEHFRVIPGSPCTECRKCDLYRSENEDEIVRRAGERAEREWRVKEGIFDVEGLMQMADGKKKSATDVIISRDWSWQDVLDWIVANLVEVRD